MPARGGAANRENRASPRGFLRIQHARRANAFRYELDRDHPEHRAGGEAEAERQQRLEGFDADGLRYSSSSEDCRRAFVILRLEHAT
jgi:hypothetical protein